MKKSTSSIESYCPIQFQPIVKADFTPIYKCKMPANVTADFFRGISKDFPCITEFLPPNILPSVPFDPLEIAEKGSPVIPNKRLLNTEELQQYDIPSSLSRTGSLLYDPFIPRFRILEEHNDQEDQDLPNYAESYRTRYDFELISEVEAFKERLFKYDTIRHAWRFKLFEACVSSMRQLNLPIDDDIFENIIQERSEYKTQQNLSETIITFAERMSDKIINEIDDSPENLESNIAKLEEFKNNMCIKELASCLPKFKLHFKNCKYEGMRELENHEHQQFCRFVERAQYYLEHLSEFGEFTLPLELHDQLYIHEKAIAAEIRNQHQELFYDLNERKEALNLIESVTYYQKLNQPASRRSLRMLPEEYKGPITPKHPNTLPDTFFYGKPTYDYKQDQIVTSYVVSDSFMENLKLNKRISSIFSRPWSNLQNTVYYLSQFHGFGLFSLFDAKPTDQITEYCGEIIGSLLSQVRDQAYLANGLDEIYMFELRDDTVIDATFMGSYARFLNHCCRPNCISYSMFLTNGKLVPNNIRITGESHGVGMFGSAALGQEVTIHYNLNKGSFEHKLPCSCGSDNCAGYMN